MNIPLAKDTIDQNDINDLIEWLKTNPQLTQGQVVKEFEEKFAAWQGRKYAILVNSGSSANLLTAFYYKMQGHTKVVVNDLSWATSIMPWSQAGMQVFLCHPSRDDLGLDLNHLEHIFKTHSPHVLFAVNVLGFLSDYDKIRELCVKYNVILAEDSCETVGSTFKGIKAGNFGEIATYSGYFGHTFSLVESGIITTDSREISNTLRMLREHGFTKTIDDDFAQFLYKEYEIDDFNQKFTFFTPAFNVRSTNINAKIGLKQIDKLDRFCTTREKNYQLYHSLIKNDFWKIKPNENTWIANFAYPIITLKRKELVAALRDAGVETRPLIAGSIARQPFWTEVHGKRDQSGFGNLIHDYGLYLPNNADITTEEIEYICKTVNGVLNQ